MKGVTMKKIATFLTVLLLVGVTFAASQPVAGKKFEFGTSFSFSSYKFSGDTDSSSALSLPLRIGYYFWEGLEIEPELMAMKFSNDLAYHLSGNLSYNFRAGQVVPFILGGAGFGNGFSVGPLVEGASGARAFLINAGAGVKILIGQSGAVRIEYRFTRNRLSGTGFVTETINSHQAFMGLSLFF
jgi:hypothetical protein